MSAPQDMPEVVVFLGIEALGDRHLRAAFEVVANGREFTAWADVDQYGDVVDLHGSHLGEVGTTGHPAVDAIVTRRARAELRRARAAAVVAQFDRRLERERASFRGRGR